MYVTRDFFITAKGNLHSHPQNAELAEKTMLVTLVRFRGKVSLFR